jgi:hypothetical protein
MVTLTFYYIGFLIHSFGGHSYSFFDTMYLFFHSISESLLSSLIIMIAYGWTITLGTEAGLNILSIPLSSQSVTQLSRR